MTSAYDAAGQRTTLTHPGSGFAINCQYYDDGRAKLIGLNGATTGANGLATYYDDLGNRRAGDPQTAGHHPVAGSSSVLAQHFPDVVHFDRLSAHELPPDEGNRPCPKAARGHPQGVADLTLDSVADLTLDSAADLISETPAELTLY